MSRIYDALTKAENHGLAKSTGNGPAEERHVEERPTTTTDLMLSDFVVQPWEADTSRLIFDDSSPEVYGIEQFRSLRSRAYQLRAKQPMQTIVVCSAVAGEGKTFVSANFSMALAKQRGRKVLLIDADLRKPSLHELLGAPSRPGLAEHISGTAELAEIIQGGPIENLWFMPGGEPVSNAAELLGNRRMADVLERLTPLFDWIILDSSPVLPVSDAVTISRSCDAVLLVARAEDTPYEMVQRAQHEFREARVLGLVLNGATERPRHGGYYNYGYGYGYGKSRRGPYGAASGSGAGR